MKRMTSQDQDQVSMKSNMFGFRGYSQIKFYKTYKTAKNGLVGFGFGKRMYFMVICDLFL